jgi:hypothetical protein
MSKVDFLENFKDISNGIDFNIEYGCEISSVNDIITDKISIFIKRIDKQVLIDMVDQIFDNKNKIIKFINDVYNKYEGSIYQIMFNYNNGHKELHIEIKTPGNNSELILSYNENNDMIDEYKLSDVSSVYELFSNEITSKINTTFKSLTEFKTNLGFIKDNTTYLIIYEPLSDLAFPLKEYYKHINNNSENIDKFEQWLQENLSNTLTFIGYKNENDKISLNIHSTDLNQYK